ncbi:MAG TPA: microcin ABC transporter permease, partial [Ramlibacter sp.]|nr:microcin ABC transporter permease [Ramlibacter sp.]
MTAYIVKRILLMLPTLFGVLVITFIVTQFVPGGPVEQFIAEAR